MTNLATAVINTITAGSTGVTTATVDPNNPQGYTITTWTGVTVPSNINDITGTWTIPAQIPIPNDGDATDGLGGMYPFYLQPPIYPQPPIFGGPLYPPIYPPIKIVPNLEDLEEGVHDIPGGKIIIKKIKITEEQLGWALEEHLGHKPTDEEKEQLHEELRELVSSEEREI